MLVKFNPVLMAILFPIVLVVIDGSIANVSLPTIASALGASNGASIWIVSGFQLAVGVALLPCGALGGTVGLKRIFMAGLLLFTLASLLCSTAPSLEFLVFCRILQGVGAAAVMALGVALIRFACLPEVVGETIGWIATGVAVASALGPTMGAAILYMASWPFLFAINLPLGVLSLYMARYLPNPSGSGAKIDWISAGMWGVCLVFFILGLKSITSHKLLGVGMLFSVPMIAALLFKINIRKREPLLPIDLLTDWSFSVSILGSVLCFAGMMGGLIAFPFLFQTDFKQGAASTGLFMTVWPLATAFVGPWAGRKAAGQLNPLLCTAGGVSLAVGLGFCSIWQPDSGSTLCDVGPLLPFLILGGLGFGIFQTPNNRNMLLNVPRARSGAAGAMQGTARLLGQSLGSIIVTSCFELYPENSAPRLALGISSVCALIGGVVSMARIRDNRR